MANNFNNTVGLGIVQTYGNLTFQSSIVETEDGGIETQPSDTNVYYDDELLCCISGADILNFVAEYAKMLVDAAHTSPANVRDGLDSIVEKYRI